MTLAIIAGLMLACLAAMFYVYKLRGNARYASLRQYLRKSWPIFALPNCVLYMCTPRWARKPFLDTGDFAALRPIQENWSAIRKEALALGKTGVFEQARTPGTVASYDVGFRTFFKYGWSRFYLRWYGHTHNSALELCPNTTKLLSAIPGVRGAMFTVLPPGAQLTPHADPMACSLRYHLGLATPNSADCYIDVDGMKQHWMDGEAFIFDETYLHHVRNDTNSHRLILMCDVQRPLNWFGRAFNQVYSLVARSAMTPNTEADRRGGASALFAWCSPILARGQLLKRSNRSTYTLIKWALNLTLLGLAITLVGAILGVAQWAVM